MTFIYCFVQNILPLVFLSLLVGYQEKRLEHSTSSDEVLLTWSSVWTEVQMTYLHMVQLMPLPSSHLLVH